jgi:thiol:disulfide interchange protein
VQATGLHALEGSPDWRITMSMLALTMALPLLGLFLLAPPAASADVASPDWQPFSPQAFQQARREGSLVLIDLTADWCAACRRMEETGFRDPRVLDTLSKHYVPVRVDIEGDPAIARRYGDYGVPSVILLDAQGNEIMKRHGYLEPDWLYWLLATVAEDPVPESHR